MTKAERMAVAESIQGWMSAGELAWLYDAADDKLAIEFGSWRGRSTAALLSANKLVCVDHWQGSIEHQGMIQGGARPWEEFNEQFASEIGTGQLVFERGDLRNQLFRLMLAAKYGYKAELVFVDASHCQDDVRQDIQLAELLVAPGGILAGHDYGNQQHPDVAAVVDEFARSKGCRPEVVGTIWWFRRKP